MNCAIQINLPCLVLPYTRDNVEKGPWTALHQKQTQFCCGHHFMWWLLRNTSKNTDCVNTAHHCIHKWQLSFVRWTEAKWKTVLRSDESKFEILFENHTHHVLWAREERDHLACFSEHSSKASIHDSMEALCENNRIIYIYFY